MQDAATAVAGAGSTPNGFNVCGGGGGNETLQSNSPSHGLPANVESPRTPQTDQMNTSLDLIQEKKIDSTQIKFECISPHNIHANNSNHRSNSKNSTLNFMESMF